MNDIRSAATAFLLDPGGKLLLKLRDDVPVWCLPGGFREADETPIENIRRELQEELCVDFAPDELKQIASYRLHQMPKNYGIAVDLFCGVLGRHQVQLGHEGVKLDFFAADNLPPNMFSNQAALVRHVWPHLPNGLVEPIDLGVDMFFEEMKLWPLSRFIGLEEWRTHPRVVAKGSAGPLALQEKVA